MTTLMPGAEPWSHRGGPSGALVLHGLSSAPGSVRAIAEALATAGFSVELPLLPGHGTSVHDMARTRWEDWATAVESAYHDLAFRCESVVVAGQSMGASLALWLAAQYPSIAGVACVNPATRSLPDLVHRLFTMSEAGHDLAPGIAGDIADPAAVEPAYDEIPVESVLSAVRRLTELEYEYGRVTCPLLLLTSPQDHVVDPAHSDYVAEHVAGPVERVTLERSYHVAALDYDRELVVERIVEFARRCSPG
jgi:carboxylesterase